MVMRYRPSSNNVQEPVSIDETMAAMAEVSYGTRVPSVKLAWWAAALSCQIKLPKTCEYTRVMARYVDAPLPERELLVLELGGNLDLYRETNGKKGLPPNCTGMVIDALYHIERLYNEGRIHFDCGRTLERQQAWRSEMVDLIPGLACKLVSWALFIYNPFDCLLLTIDTWHCRRLGIDQSLIAGSSVCKKREYHKTEAMMLRECLGLYPLVPPVITAAMLWENIRRANGASDTVEYTSHRGISCRWY